MDLSEEEATALITDIFWWSDRTLFLGEGHPNVWNQERIDRQIKAERMIDAATLGGKLA